MSKENDDLATKLLCGLTQDMIAKSELFDYLCWLEETRQQDRVKGADFLVLASDGRTCWGKTYRAAVRAALEHDRELYEAVQNLDLTGL